MSLHVITHPIAQHFLTELRKKDTGSARFREVCKHLTTFLIAEATKSLKTKIVKVETPTALCSSTQLDEGIVIVPILRAGLCMLQAAMDLIPDVSVGYIGMQRDETTAIATSYYRKLPKLENKSVLILDPMMATGNSAEKAINYVLEKNPSRIAMVSIISAPEGVRRLENLFPEIPIYTVSVDERIDNRRFIIPGLGDFGDRAFDTM